MTTLAVLSRGKVVVITAGVESDGSCAPLAPGKRVEFYFKVESPLFVNALALYPHELGRVDVKVSFRGATVRWSTLYQVEDVNLDTVWRPEDSVLFSLANVSMETVLARVMIRGWWL
jgi:hypothetical protein